MWYSCKVDFEEYRSKDEPVQLIDTDENDTKSVLEAVKDQKTPKTALEVLKEHKNWGLIPQTFTDQDYRD